MSKEVKLFDVYYADRFIKQINAYDESQAIAIVRTAYPDVAVEMLWAKEVHHNPAAPNEMIYFPPR